METINKGIQNTIELRSFLYDIRYIVLFYVIGDIITTFLFLRMGYLEGNLLLSAMLAKYGIGSLIALKMLVLGSLYITYKLMADVSSRWERVFHYVWKMMKYDMSLGGVILVINNMMVMHSGYTLFQLIGNVPI